MVYIKDGEGTQPAVILYEDRLNEVAVVNPRHASYNFIPVDNNITVVEPQTQNKVSVCDAMILTDGLQEVYFIELKDVRKQWSARLSVSWNLLSEYSMAAMVMLHSNIDWHTQATDGILSLLPIGRRKNSLDVLWASNL